MRVRVAWSLLSAVLMAVFSFGAGEADGGWRPAERWRGFNLLGMFMNHGQTPEFPEHEFALISEFGFNFVRLPMDYRFWIKDGDWEQINEEVIKVVDQAVAYGAKYGLHVQLCFHRAPGYTVAKPAEERDLFSDSEALRVCCNHWRYFARRYRGIPSERLSFNLFNEPGKVDEGDYVRVATALVKAIRSEDAGRFIVADGVEWGNRGVEGLFGLGIGQASRGYNPMSISHYLASWVGTPSAIPVWPLTDAGVSPLYGPSKSEWRVPLEIRDAPAGVLELKPGMVSGEITLSVKGDGGELALFELKPGEGDGWSNAVFKSEWSITQAYYKGVLRCKLPGGLRRVSVDIVKGDWMALEQLVIRGEGGTQEAVLPMVNNWGKVNKPFYFKGFDVRSPLQQADRVASGEEYLRRNFMDGWQSALDQGVFVMVGEFGAFNRTPHALVLEWLEDNLKVWQSMGVGWALWNFTGSFGIVDSGRKDVAYEEYKGVKLDRRMLELLQRY